MTSIDPMTVHVPGTAMDRLRMESIVTDPESAAMVPENRPRAVNAGRALREAPEMRRGRGFTYQVTAEPDTLMFLADTMRTYADALEEERDREHRATINSLRSCASRIKGAVRMERMGL